jgi:amino acid efflux transporter
MISSLRRTLGLRDGTVLALGSIAGSGILFLPSLTYSLVGHDALLSWLGAMLLCIPMLFMFADMVRSVPDGSGIEGFIARGLGPHVATSVPYLFLSLFWIGMPAGVLVAGDYFARAVGGGVAAQLIAGLAIVGVALVANLRGIQASARFQNLVTWGVLAAAAVLIAATIPAASQHYDAVAPTFGALGPIVSGGLVAFWAFSGFENLTFIAGEFRNPRRDFPLAMILAFVAYGGLAVALTTHIAGVVPRGEVDQLTGLFQLAETVEPRWLAIWLITAFAVALLQTNATSWIWGMSRLVYASASADRLPRFLARLDDSGVPHRGVALVGGVLIVVTSLFALVPGVLVQALITASAVFALLYVLCVVSYWRCERSILKRAAAAGVLAVLLTALAGAGWRVAYPLVVFALSLGVSALRERNKRARYQTSRPAAA